MTQGNNIIYCNTADTET